MEQMSADMGRQQTELQGTLDSMKSQIADFDTQLDAAEELYGIQLHFSFTPKDVCTELASLADYYPLEIRQRVEQIIRRQMRKYGYLMRS